MTQRQRRPGNVPIVAGAWQMWRVNFSKSDTARLSISRQPFPIIEERGIFHDRTGSLSRTYPLCHDTCCRIVIRHASFDAARMLAAAWALIGTTLVPLLSGLFGLNYDILKLQRNRIRHNPKKSMKINVSCGL